MPRLQLKMLLYTPGVNFAAVLQGEELCYCHKKHPSKKTPRVRLLEEKVSRMGRDKPASTYILNTLILKSKFKIVSQIVLFYSFPPGLN